MESLIITLLKSVSEWTLNVQIVFFFFFFLSVLYFGLGKSQLRHLKSVIGVQMMSDQHSYSVLIISWSDRHNVVLILQKSNFNKFWLLHTILKIPKVNDLSNVYYLILLLGHSFENSVNALLSC